MKIGELAKLSGCTVETIRYYEHEQVLPAPKRSSGGYRQYREEHLSELNFILHCRSLGMSLAEIRLLLGFRADPSLACDEINQLIDRHIGRVHQQLASLQQLEHQLQALREHCHDGSDAAHCGILQTLVRIAGDEACACDAPDCAQGKRKSPA
jgi:Cd(II)/Pb(II)-responsive transcriptional regulator